MEYRSLGRTGDRVSELCLGTMMLGVKLNPADTSDGEQVLAPALRRR